jgi:predicted transcriptional regulator
LADANRLKIVGLLAQQEYTVEQLAVLLGLGPSTVSHHLTRLAKAGLVSARAESYYNYYRLEKDTLAAIATRVLSDEALAEAANSSKSQEKETEADRYAQKVLNNYLLPDGRIKTIPAQRKKLEVILRHLLQAFEPDIRYSEKMVNQILSRFHADTASLRREMIGFHLMEREKGEYWRAESGLSQDQTQEVHNE